MILEVLRLRINQRIALLDGMMMIDDLGFRVWHQMMLHTGLLCCWRSPQQAAVGR